MHESRISEQSFNYRNENMNDDNQDRKPNFKAYYKKYRPNYFSDTIVTYDVPLTEELFNVQMDYLSTNKLQSKFEKFVVAVASKIITPNIQPQSGPDGGGDGKVDAETYEVSKDISDKWYSEESGAAGKEKWAFAISCKKQWQPKLESDVSKIVETNRGYTKVLFFTNQYVKSSTRVEKEESISQKYGIETHVFDRSWFNKVVFTQGCLDEALNNLDFSDQYKIKKVNEGPLDRQRKTRLEELENSFLRPIDGLNTEYVDDLKESCILSRELERPRCETEGRFRRALSECTIHGTRQQYFVLVYEHGWTSFFWFEDVEAVYKDYLILKDIIEEEASVPRVERLVNTLSNLDNAAKAGFIEQNRIVPEIEYIQKLSSTLDGVKPSCKLFLDIQLAVRELLQHIGGGVEIESVVEKLKPLLLLAPSHIDISFESLYQVMEMLAQYIDDASFDSLLDELADRLSKNRSEVEAAKVRFERAQNYIDKENWKEAICQLGFCVYAFEKEECSEELVKSSGMMGIALWHLNLPYTAEAYLLKSAAILMRKFYAEGQIHHLLITVLNKLCEIELMTGRLVMYFNFIELRSVLASNAQFNEEKEYIEQTWMQDAAWMCRLADCDLSMPIVGKLPDIFFRLGMQTSSEGLKLLLGYPDEVDSDYRAVFDIENLRGRLQSQPVFEQFFDDINISDEGMVHLKTTVNNFNIVVSYHNNIVLQEVAEIFLASVESFMATADIMEIVAIDTEILIHLKAISEGRSDIMDTSNVGEYCFNFNTASYTDSEFWACISKFIVILLSKNALTKGDILQMIEQKHQGERLMDRVSVLLHTKFAKDAVLGTNYKYQIKDWIRPTDKVYEFKGELDLKAERKYFNSQQETMSIYKMSTDVSLWDDAGWRGCGFICDIQGEYLPIFGLAFMKVEKGIKIVEEWKKKVADGKPAIKVFIIRKIDRHHLAHYRVCISPEIPEEREFKNRYMAAMTRIQTMTPITNENLSRFEREYKKFGGCWMMAMQIDEHNQLVRPENYKNAFRFANIEFYDAYEVGVYDEARIAILPFDDPYIPEGSESNAPVLALLEELKDFSKKKQI